MDHDINRFIWAQERAYDRALAEITAGKKRGHWMWFVFPQFKGLGLSEKARYYAIKSLTEAEDYLAHPVLGARLREISSALLSLDTSDPLAVLGDPDDLKLQSSMTLFAQVDRSEDILFQQVLDKFFQGEVDRRTLAIIEEG